MLPDCTVIVIKNVLILIFYPTKNVNKFIEIAFKILFIAIKWSFVLVIVPLSMS